MTISVNKLGVKKLKTFFKFCVVLIRLKLWYMYTIYTINKLQFIKIFLKWFHLRRRENSYYIDHQRSTLQNSKTSRGSYWDQEHINCCKNILILSNDPVSLVNTLGDGAPTMAIHISTEFSRTVYIVSSFSTGWLTLIFHIPADSNRFFI